MKRQSGTQQCDQFAWTVKVAHYSKRLPQLKPSSVKDGAYINALKHNNQLLDTTGTCLVPLGTGIGSESWRRRVGSTRASSDRPVTPWPDVQKWASLPEVAHRRLAQTFSPRSLCKGSMRQTTNQSINQTAAVPFYLARKVTVLTSKFLFIVKFFPFGQQFF